MYLIWRRSDGWTRFQTFWTQLCRLSFQPSLHTLIVDWLRLNFSSFIPNHNLDSQRGEKLWSPVKNFPLNAPWRNFTSSLCVFFLSSRLPPVVQNNAVSTETLSHCYPPALVSITVKTEAVTSLRPSNVNTPAQCQPVDRIKCNTSIDFFKFHQTSWSPVYMVRQEISTFNAGKWNLFQSGTGL